MEAKPADEYSPLMSSKNSEDNPDLTESGGSSTSGKLQRTVGVLSACAIIFGNCVGAGVFISPKGVYERVGSAGSGLVIWAMTGVVATLCTLAYSELGTMIPRSGGEFMYIKRTFGNLPAFLFSFCTAFLIKPASNSVCALLFSEYLAAAIWGEDVPHGHLTVQLMTVALLLIIGITNIVSCKLVVKFCSVASILKLAVVGFLVVCGVFISITGQGQKQNLDPATSFFGSSTNPTDYASAFFFCSLSYQGWNSLNFMQEELKNPMKTLPLGGSIGITMVTLSYVLINVAYLMLFTVSDIVNSSTIGMDSGYLAFGKTGQLIMSIGLMVSTAGAASGSMLVTSRIMQSTAGEGMFPRWMANVSLKLETPVEAISTLVAFSIAYVFFDASVLIPCLASVEWMFYCVTFCCLVYLRYKEPKTERPFKIPLALAIFLVVLTASIVVLPLFSKKERMTALIGLGFLPIGCVFYGLRHFYNHFNKSYKKRLSDSISNGSVDTPMKYTEEAVR